MYFVSNNVKLPFCISTIKEIHSQSGNESTVSKTGIFYVSYQSDLALSPLSAVCLTNI